MVFISLTMSMFILMPSVVIDALSMSNPLYDSKQRKQLDTTRNKTRNMEPRQHYVFGEYSTQSIESFLQATTATTSHPHTVYYSTRRTTNSILKNLFEIGVTGIEEKVKKEQIMHYDTMITDHHKSGIGISSGYISDSYNPNGNMERGDYKWKPQHGVDHNNQIKQQFPDIDIQPSIVEYLDLFGGDIWGQFKSMILSYVNWAEDGDQLHDLEEKLPLRFITRMLALGDRVNFVRVVRRRVDSGLAEYLADQMEPLFDQLKSFGLPLDGSGSISNLLMNGINKGGTIILNQFRDSIIKASSGLVSPADLKILQKDLKKTNPIAAMGLEVLLKGNAHSATLDEVEGRSYSRNSGIGNYRGVSDHRQRDGFGPYGNSDGYGTKDGYGNYDGYGSAEGYGQSNGYGKSEGYGQSNGYGKSTGYGHSSGYGHSAGYGYSGGYGHSGGGYGGHGAYDGGYGHSGGGHSGYSQGVMLDPYLILGGIGAAAALAFIAYRILVTTARRRRSLDDLTFMDLSDVPNFVNSIYTLLDTAEDTYKNTTAHSDLDKVDDYQDSSDELVLGINSLWWAKTNSSDACVRCSLFEYVQHHAYHGEESADNLVMAFIAYILDAEEPGQLLDEVITQTLDGDQITCDMFHNSCHI